MTIRKKYTILWIAVFFVTSACNSTESKTKIRASVSSQFLRPHGRADIGIEISADYHFFVPVPDGTDVTITTNRGSFSQENAVLSVNEKTINGHVYLVLYLDDSLGQIYLKIQCRYLTEIQPIAFVSKTSFLKEENLPDK